jgi:heme-degrading monooxygenase HmoA
MQRSILTLLTTVFLTLNFAVISPGYAETRIASFSAYADPVEGEVQISDHGVSNWNGSMQTLTWYGQFETTGAIDVAVELKLPAGAPSSLTMTLGEQSRSVTVKGDEQAVVRVDFGRFEIERVGYQSFRLSSDNDAGASNGEPVALVIDGAVTKDAHFNLLPRRNAASVHLAYPVPEGMQVSAFYCEMTAIEDPLYTYYMACGWHRGYFGMQVNHPNERRIIFSVWDSGNEAIERGKVANENRVQLVAKGDDVYSGDFGNEGTGGHSHLKFLWKTGEKQRFLVTAEPVDATHTIFAGYYFHPEKNEWMLISSWNAPKEGGRLRGLYSFSENFAGENGHLLRKALYTNQWIRTAEGKWLELTRATFSHDVTGRADRRDRSMGVEDGDFFLSHGGFVDGYTEFGKPFDRPAVGKSPAEGDLPPLPE